MDIRRAARNSANGIELSANFGLPALTSRPVLYMLSSTPLDSGQYYANRVLLCVQSTEMSELAGRTVAERSTNCPVMVANNALARPVPMTAMLGLEKDRCLDSESSTKISRLNSVYTYIIYDVNRIDFTIS